MGRQGKATPFQTAGEAIYRFLLDGTRPGPSIEANHRGPWDPTAPIATGGPNAGSANYRLMGGMVQMCLGGRDQVEAEQMFAGRWEYEMSNGGLGLIEGPFSGYDAIHWSAIGIVHEITDSRELRAIARRRARAQWELIERTGVVRAGVLDAIGPGNRFDQLQAGGADRRQVPSAIAAHWTGSWHPYDEGGSIRHPGAAEWLLRAVRLCPWEDIREEPLRLDDVRSAAPYQAYRWPDGSRAAWIDHGSANQDPAMLGVTVSPAGEVGWLWLPEWIAGADPKEGGHGGSRATFDGRELRGLWRVGGRDLSAWLTLPGLIRDSTASLITVRVSSVADGHWPPLDGLRSAPETPKRRRPAPGKPTDPAPTPTPLADRYPDLVEARVELVGLRAATPPGPLSRRVHRATAALDRHALSLGVDLRTRGSAAGTRGPAQGPAPEPGAASAAGGDLRADALALREHVKSARWTAIVDRLMDAAGVGS